MIFILPSISSILQSAILAKYLLWVAKIIVLSFFLCWNNNLKIDLAFSLSKLPVGSSAKIIFGELIIALLIATLWASPPDICDGKWLILLFRPTFSILKGCIKTKRSYLEKERRHIIRSLKELEKIQSNLFVYDVLNQFCDLEYCYVGKGKEVFFLDDNHLSPEGIDYIYPHFIEFLNRKGLLSNFISKKEAGWLE